VGRVSYEFSGQLATLAADEAIAKDLVARLRKQLAAGRRQGLHAGPMGGAKNESLAQARAAGYAIARWDSTTAQVDAQHNRVDISVVLDSGPLYHLGELRIDGLLRQEPSSVRRLASFSPGDAYSEQALLDFQERLQRSGLFDSVTVDIDPDPKLAAATPVVVRVTESKLQEATVSVGYSANTGQRIALEHLHRRPFGLNVRAKNKLEWGKENRLFEGELTSHATPGMYRNLMLLRAERLLVNDEQRDSFRLRVGRLQETTARDRTYFVEGLRSKVVNAAGVTRGDAISANYQWTWRRVDSILLPTTGWAASAHLAGGYARGGNAENGPFTRAWGRLNWYRPLGSHWFSNLRMEAGQVFARDAVGVPDGLLFRAGGDDSVRGYAFESLSPKVAGVAHGGRVIWTGSAEVSRPLFTDLPQYLGAVFVDAGQAADRWNGLKPVIGYGVGVRWRSPVGPLRVDLAWPERESKPRLHFSVGIVF
jgi:translocation and assembly module TamA